MLSMTETPDTFYLRIQKPEEQEQLRKKEILVRWSITLEKGLTWEYVRHEFFERPVLDSDWTKTDAYQVPMTNGLQVLIESHLEWEVWDEFFDSAKSLHPKQHLPIDRRRLFQILLAWRMSRMSQAKSVAEAVDALRQRIGGSLYDLANRCKLSPPSLYFASSGARGLSGRTLTKLAELADRLMEWKVAELLRSHAMVASLNVSRKGGHR